MASQPRPIPSVTRQRKERHLFSTSDDSAMMKQVQATHAPDGREVDVNPIIKIVEEILLKAIAESVEGHDLKREDTLETAAALAEFDMLDSLAFIIQKISCELSCKCSGGGDAHASTMVLLNYLSNYSWHAKVVLTLAAFAVIFGEFWLVAQMSVTNILAKSVAILKQLPDIEENSTSLRPQFDALNKLVKAALEVTKCIVEFKGLPSEYISEDTPPMSTVSSHIPIASYWVIRSIVACASQIVSLIGMRNESISSATEPWELSSLAHKLNSIYEHLKNQLTQCYQYIDEKRHMEAFHNLIRLFDMVHVDNMKILRALIYAKDDRPPLIVGTTRATANVEVLRRKHVLLLISDLDLSVEEIMILDNLYKDPSRSRGETHYEMVWIPIVEKATWNEANKQKFESLLSIMAWYCVYDPFIIEPSVIKYIKEVWNFTKKAIIVALDPQGKLSSPNALHMIWIWGNLAFPFTREKEESLWKQEIWSLELLVDGIDPTVLEWITEGKFICIYGGEDLEWIQTFTITAMNVAKAGNFELEMVYVGKSNAKERMQKMINTFATRKFSYYWPNVTSIWFFWARLESMLYSKLQHGRTVENDQIMSEVMTVLSFDGSDRGWAIFCRGTAEMARAKGDTALTSLQDFDKWKGNIESQGFVPALGDYLKQIQTPHHCNRLILPGSTGGIPQRVVCAECGRQMEKYFMYRCCVE